MSKLKTDLHEVTLLRDHTHAGEKSPAGKKIQVSEPVKKWLQSQGVVATDVINKTDITGGEK